MGYTHYWTIKEPLDREQFATWAKGVTAIVETAIEAGIPLGNGIGEDKPELSESLIAFNGIGNQGVETFGISADDEGFDFCKTGGALYDSAVTASLIYAKEIFGDAIEIKSDGTWEDWESGQLLYETVFDVQPDSVLA